MKALITGAGGQLGRALQATLPAGVTAVALTSHALDITDAAAVARVVADQAPRWLINAAAYTAVDRAERDAVRAMQVNGAAVAQLAAAARRCGARFAQISTDFVFDGTGNQPIRPDHRPNPVSVYGTTKCVGEQNAGADALIVRTAWVYADAGANFVATMLRLMHERDEIRVVDDQYGTPTYADDLARSIWALTANDATGIFHHTDSGVASWYDFAVAIHEEARAAGVLGRDVTVVPIATADYPTPARRPAYSVLNKTATWALTGTIAPHWRANLRTMLKRKSGS